MHTLPHIVVYTVYKPCTPQTFFPNAKPPSFSCSPSPFPSFLLPRRSRTWSPFLARVFVHGGNKTLAYFRLIAPRAHARPPSIPGSFIAPSFILFRFTVLPHPVLHAFQRSYPRTCTRGVARPAVSRVLEMSSSIFSFGLNYARERIKRPLKYPRVVTAERRDSTL